MASATRLVLVSEGLEREHRAEHLALDDLALVRARNDERRLVEEPAALGRPAAANDLVAVRPRALDEAGDPLEVVAVDQRRDGGVVVARVAEHVLVGEAVEQLEELLGDRLLDEQARPGEAHLAGVVVLSRRLARSRLEVAVVEDEQRAFAAELAGERDDVLRRRDADVTRGLGRARERDAAHAGVRRRARRRPLRRSPARR